MDAKTRTFYRMQAEVITAVAHPIRVAIVDFLRDGEQCVCDIAGHVGAKRSNVSRHLAVMLKAGVVEYRKDGLRMMYSLKAPCVLTFLSCVTQLLREHAGETADILGSL
jgi:ArsR family transcriptional regulator